jgi:hypothetical protein
MLAELTRAIAAAHRYEDLRYRRTRREAPDGIPRQVFEEFYSAAETVEARSPERPQPDAPDAGGRAASALP